MVKKLTTASAALAIIATTMCTPTAGLASMVLTEKALGGLPSLPMTKTITGEVRTPTSAPSFVQQNVPPVTSSDTRAQEKSVASYAITVADGVELCLETEGDITGALRAGESSTDTTGTALSASKKCIQPSGSPLTVFVNATAPAGATAGTYGGAAVAQFFAY